MLLVACGSSPAVSHVGLPSPTVAATATPVATTMPTAVTCNPQLRATGERKKAVFSFACHSMAEFSFASSWLGASIQLKTEQEAGYINQVFAWFQGAHGPSAKSPTSENGLFRWVSEFSSSLSCGITLPFKGGTLSPIVKSDMDKVGNNTKGYILTFPRTTPVEVTYWCDDFST